MAQNNKARASGQSATFLLLLGGIFVLLNVLGVFVNVRSDWTDRELFSLSNGSKRLVSTLSDRMEITAYFSPDLPPPHNATERYVRDLLTEYKDASKGNVALRFVHPSKDEEKQAAERDGVKRVQDQKLESDSFSVYEGFRGVAFKYKGDTRAIPAISNTDGLEYEITQIIKELAGEKVKIGVVGGHNPDPAPDPMQMQMGMQKPKGGVKMDAIKGYLPTYEVQEVKLDKEVSTDLKALLVVQPESAFTETELRYLNQFVMKGGSLAVMGGYVQVDMNGQNPTGKPVDSGLNKLLEKWGVTMIPGAMVADAQCGRARMPTNFGIPIAVPYPPAPVVTFEDKQREHPVLFRLDQVPMPYITPLALNDALKGDNEVKRTVLAQSTKYSWAMRGEPIDLKARERWEVPKERESFVLGVAFEGKLPTAFGEEAVSSAEGGDEGASAIKAPARAEKPVHVLVFGTGYFLRDEFMPPSQGQRVVPGGAAALALNAIDWLAQDSDLIAIRAKSVEDPSLEVPQKVKEAEATIREAIGEQNEDKADAAFKERKDSMAAWDSKKTTYRWANTLGLPLAFAVFGIIRWRVRKATRANLKL
jgi:ABC-2 type transport system permease protein